MKYTEEITTLKTKLAYVEKATYFNTVLLLGRFGLDVAPFVAITLALILK